MEENISEVARLRALIELEYSAAVGGLQGFAQMSRHAFIGARMDTMSRYHQQLANLVGEQEAIQIVVDVIEAGHESKS